MKTKIMKFSDLKREMVFAAECTLNDVERQRIWASYKSYDSFLAIDDIIPYDKNPRLNEDAVDAVSVSISKYGFWQPLVLNDENLIIVGHTRRLAAQAIGLAFVPALFARDLTPEDVKAYRLDDNKTGEISNWDLSLLPDEILELQDAGYDMSSLAFSEEEMERILSLAEDNSGIDEDMEEDNDDDTDIGIEAEDEIPASSDAECDSVVGGIYQLGKHRLACGDCTDGLLIAKLLEQDGATPVRLLFADIPASTSKAPEAEKGKSKRSRKADQISSEDFGALVNKTFANCMAYLGKGDSFYVFHAPLDAHVCVKALEENDGAVMTQVIWAKNHFTQSIDCYMSKHTPILFGWKHGGSHKWYGKHDNTTTTVQKWKMDDYDRPVEMLEFFIRNSSKNGEIVMDAFSKTGAAVLACESVGRICRAFAVTSQIADSIRKQWAEEVHGEGCDWVSLTQKVGQITNCD